MPEPFDLSLPDWEARLLAGKSLVPEVPILNPAEAERALAIYRRLRLPDVPGNPTLGEAGGPWFEPIVRALFGSLDPVTQRRMVRETLLLIPKKQTKTTSGGALMLTAALMSQRPRADFLFIGPTQNIADLGFGQALGMVLADPGLNERIHIQEHKKRFTVRATGVRLSIKTFDPKILTGSKPAGVLIDEPHILGEMEKADRVIGQLRGGMLPIPEAFIAWMTTQSERPPAGVFRALLQLARAIRDGRQQGVLMPVLYEFPERMVRSGEWQDPKNWRYVTPNVDRTVTIDRLVEEHQTAVAAGEAELRRWASQHLNVEIGLALHSDRWPGALHWEKRALPTLTLDELIARCEVAVVGADGGGLDDLFGLCVLGRERGTQRWLAWHKAWVRRQVLTDRKQIAALLLDLEQEGSLRILDDKSNADVEEAADIIERLEAAGILAEGPLAIGVDPVGIADLVAELRRRGFDVDSDGPTRRISGVPQGMKLQTAMLTAERRLARGELWHDGTRLMAWCVGNAKVEQLRGARMINKYAAGSAKIDPLIAEFNAISLMNQEPQAAGQSFWNSAA